jgi:hypothetical protein
MTLHAPLTDAVVKLTGQDGNAFNVLAVVRKAVLKSNRPDLADDFMREATQHDYDHLLRTCMRYVEVE